MALDSWEKLGVAGGLVGGILVPVAIYLAGQNIAATEKENAKLTTQAGHLTSLIGPLSSDQSKQQLIAVEVANHLAKTGQLPPELLPTLLRIAREAESSETALKATDAVIAAAKADNETKKAVSAEFANVPPRVYFHIPRPDMRDRAAEAAKALQAAMKNTNLVVPGVEVRSGPSRTELRFFKASEREEAAAIQTALRGAGVDARLVDLSSRYGNVEGIRPRHYELWFGLNA